MNDKQGRCEMKKLVLFLVTWVFTVGVVNATPTMDCGDDKAKPIEVSVVK